jgi:hypothetical protein
MRAIWYRHWLELRWPVAVLCALTLAAAIGYGFAVESAAGYLARSGKLTQEIARYEAIRQMSRGPQLVPLGVHTFFVAFLAIWGSSLFRGNGLDTHTRGNWTRHGSLYFTVSLPLSRSWIVASRTAAGVAALACVLTVSLAVHVIALLMIGEPIPIVAMATTTLLGVVAGLALISFGAALSLVTSEWVGGLTTFAITNALWWTHGGWNRTLDFVAGRSLLALAGVIVSSVLLVWAGYLLFAVVMSFVIYLAVGIAVAEEA